MTDEIRRQYVSGYVTLADMLDSVAEERAGAAADSTDMPLRAQLLREAEEITCGDRHMDYGDPVTNHERIAAIASAATGHQLSAHDVVMVLIAAKMARARISPMKRDHYVDMMAYAGIAYECAVDAAERQDDDGDMELDRYDV